MELSLFSTFEVNWASGEVNNQFLLCRCREKQRNESSRLQTVNRKLTAMNKLLMEENDRLQKQVSQLVCENGYMRQQLNTVSLRFSLQFYSPL